jgi:hypothetical protein
MNSIPNKIQTWDELLDTEILPAVRSSIICLAESDGILNKKYHIFLKYSERNYHVDLYDIDQNKLFQDMAGSILELKEIMDEITMVYKLNPVRVSVFFEHTPLISTVYNLDFESNPLFRFSSYRETGNTIAIDCKVYQSDFDPDKLSEDFDDFYNMVSRYILPRWQIKVNDIHPVVLERDKIVTHLRIWSSIINIQ